MLTEVERYADRLADQSRRPHVPNAEGHDRHEVREMYRELYGQP
jgi:hypothetical protein